MVPNVSSFLRCIVLRVCSLIMIKVKPFLLVNICLPLALFLIAGLGLILNLMPKIWFMLVSTVAASCRLHQFFILSILKKRKRKLLNSLKKARKLIRPTLKVWIKKKFCLTSMMLILLLPIRKTGKLSLFQNA